MGSTYWSLGHAPTVTVVVVMVLDVLLWQVTSTARLASAALASVSALPAAYSMNKTGMLISLHPTCPEKGNHK